jgi:hypothetical protein
VQYCNAERETSSAPLAFFVPRSCSNQPKPTLLPVAFPSSLSMGGVTGNLFEGVKIPLQPVTVNI